MGLLEERLGAEVDLLDLCSKLEQAAINVERARMSGVAECLAGWEHLTIRHAIRDLRAPRPVERIGHMSKYRHIIVAGCVVVLASIADKAGYHAIAMVVMGFTIAHLASRLDRRAA